MKSGIQLHLLSRFSREQTTDKTRLLEHLPHHSCAVEPEQRHPGHAAEAFSFADAVMI